MSYAVDGCNVVAILSMAGIVCLEDVETVECMSWVCMVCWSKLCEILLLLNMADMDCLLCRRLWSEQR